MSSPKIKNYGFYGPSSRERLLTETCRAIDSLGGWIRNGDTIEDAMEKVKSSYGNGIYKCVIVELKLRA
jgi:hypothetical protein